jgi:hypothetical protein
VPDAVVTNAPENTTLAVAPQVTPVAVSLNNSVLLVSNNTTPTPGQVGALGITLPQPNFGGNLDLVELQKDLAQIDQLIADLKFAQQQAVTQYNNAIRNHIDIGLLFDATVARVRNDPNYQPTAADIEIAALYQESRRLMVSLIDRIDTIQMSLQQADATRLRIVQLILNQGGVPVHPGIIPFNQGGGNPNTPPSGYQILPIVPNMGNGTA